MELYLVHHLASICIATYFPKLLVPNQGVGKSLINVLTVFNPFIARTKLLKTGRAFANKINTWTVFCSGLLIITLKGNLMNIFLRYYWKMMILMIVKL